MKTIIWQKSLLAEAAPLAQGGRMGYDPRLELARTWADLPAEDRPGSRGVRHRGSVDVSRSALSDAKGIEAITWPLWRQSHG